MPDENDPFAEPQRHHLAFSSDWMTIPTAAAHHVTKRCNTVHQAPFSTLYISSDPQCSVGEN